MRHPATHCVAHGHRSVFVRCRCGAWANAGRRATSCIGSSAQPCRLRAGSAARESAAHCRLCEIRVCRARTTRALCDGRTALSSVCPHPPHTVTAHSSMHNSGEGRLGTTRFGRFDDSMPLLPQLHRVCVRSLKGRTNARFSISEVPRTNLYLVVRSECSPHSLGTCRLVRAVLCRS